MRDSREILAYMAIKHHGDWREIYDAIIQREDIDDADFDNTIKSIGCQYITILDNSYPTQLKSIPQPPFVLFYYGDCTLLNNFDNNLSVVGSRDFSEYGKESTIKLVSGVSKDIVIVSGLARGIDSIAHQAAIDSGHRTIAVLGSGINICYPASNKKLYEEIKKNHLVISEYPENVYPDPSKFPSRNRIIAGLSYGVLITDAKKQSGTLITSVMAQNFGREVMCIPYPIDVESACNDLIKAGAFLVDSSDEVNYIMEHYTKIVK